MRHFENAIGEAFGKGIVIGFVTGLVGGSALMLVLGIATGAYR